MRPLSGLGLELEAANAAAFKEDARVKIALRGDRLYSPNPSVDMKIEAGQFADNERLELFAYLVDVAGNVGGDGGQCARRCRLERTLHGTNGSNLPLTGCCRRRRPEDAADDVTDGVNESTNVPIIGDATAPKVTIIYPNPDSLAAGSHDPLITAAITQTLSNYVRRCRVRRRAWPPAI